NNAAALLISNEEYQTARRLLEKVSPQSPSVWNNLGVVYLHQGELDKAEELLNQAALVGLKEAVHNLEEVKKKREDDKKLKIEN
ncbi:tetratricopeptide repeat protein, partial [Bacteroides sp. 224]|uniref:tetratricopeptide repeat protein n=1 Tax=Bacteroides sp. 224 TaxID=2302936 RepID=UPI0013CFDBA2